jgi:hypothetical protein
MRIGCLKNSCATGPASIPESEADTGWANRIRANRLVNGGERFPRPPGQALVQAEMLFFGQIQVLSEEHLLSAALQVPQRGFRKRLILLPSSDL